MSIEVIENPVAAHNISCDGCGKLIAETWFNDIDDLNYLLWEKDWRQEDKRHYCPGCKKGGKG